MFKFSDLKVGQCVDLKNEIALVSPVDTPLATLLYQRGRVVPAYDVNVSWMEKTLNGTELQARQEGAEAVEGVNSAIATFSNVCQILETGTKVSGTVQALNPKGMEDVYVSEINDRMAELKIAQEKFFLDGTYNAGTDGQPRQMKGLLKMAQNHAIEGELNEDHIIDAMELMFNKGVHGDVYLFCGAKAKRKINKFANAENGAMYVVQAGVNRHGVLVQEIATDFGNISIVVDRHLPQNSMLLVDIDQVEIAELRPAFYEALPKNGDYFHGHIISENTVKLLNQYSAVNINGFTL